MSELHNLILIVIIFGFFFVFFGILFGFTYCVVKCCDCLDHEHNNNDDQVQPDHVSITIITGCVGLHPFVLRSIPIVEFNSKDYKDVVECVVCLAELANGDKARALPSCDHLFHVACIDSKMVRLEQRVTRQELGRAAHEGLTQDHEPTSEHHELPTNPPPRSSDTTMTEDDDGCGKANEDDGCSGADEYDGCGGADEYDGCGGADEDDGCGGAEEGPPDLMTVVIDIPAK
ncbi:hypothetical protein CARUB_v10015625mg [Capsella rubella]|uniref:RING-type domain-containing protein n=1 Tax=Capsella rubella TaxID=81985 RepID=R0I7C8_9BRAS|nr:hypothetical protein CARUB_v10015625mg [Capsella rubella]